MKITIELEESDVLNALSHLKILQYRELSFLEKVFQEAVEVQFFNRILNDFPRKEITQRNL